jgi:hypothetical protein
MSGKNLEIENKILQDKINYIYTNYYLIKKKPTIITAPNFDNIDWLNVHNY